MKPLGTKTKSVKVDDHRTSVQQTSFSQARRSRISSTPSLGHGVRQTVQWRLSTRGMKIPKYQNSYRLEPFLPFCYETSDEILRRVMTEYLKDERYDSERTVSLCQTISQAIIDRLYKTDYDRVKYAVMITIIENGDQSFSCGNGRLWDSQRDTYSIFVYDQPTFYAIGLIAVMYFE